jgi:PilZ domain
MTGKMKHERKSTRVRRRFKVTLKQGPSFSVDVGEGGLCTELLRVLPPGTLVEGTILVKGADVPFAGRVVWARPGAPHLGLRGRMGILFTEMASKDLLLADGAPRRA